MPGTQFTRDHTDSGLPLAFVNFMPGRLREQTTPGFRLHIHVREEVIDVDGGGIACTGITTLCCWYTRELLSSPGDSLDLRLEKHPALSVQCSISNLRTYQIFTVGIAHSARVGRWQCAATRHLPLAASSPTTSCRKLCRSTAALAITYVVAISVQIVLCELIVV